MDWNKYIYINQMNIQFYMIHCKIHTEREENILHINSLLPNLEILRIQLMIHVVFISLSLMKIQMLFK